MVNINITLAPANFKAGETKKIVLSEVAYLDYKSALTKLQTASMRTFKEAFELANVCNKGLVSQGANDKMVEVLGKIAKTDAPSNIKTVAHNMVAKGLKEYRIPYLKSMELQFVPTLNSENKVDKVEILLVESQITIEFGETENKTIYTELSSHYLTSVDFEKGIISLDQVAILKMIKDSKFNEVNLEDKANKKTYDKLEKINQLINANIDVLAESKKVQTLNNLSDKKIQTLIDDMIYRVQNSEKVAEIRESAKIR